MKQNKKVIKPTVIGKEAIPKPKLISKYKKNLFKTRKVQNLLKKIMPEYYEK